MWVQISIYSQGIWKTRVGSFLEVFSNSCTKKNAAKGDLLRRWPGDFWGPGVAIKLEKDEVHQNIFSDQVGWLFEFTWISWFYHDMVMMVRFISFFLRTGESPSNHYKVIQSWLLYFISMISCWIFQGSLYGPLFNAVFFPRRFT